MVAVVAAAGGSGVVLLLLVLFLLTMREQSSPIRGRDIIHTVKQFTRPLWGRSDEPAFEKELFNYGFTAGSSSCSLYGWSNRSRPRRVFDAFLFSLELDVLLLRLKELDGVVDRWIIVESERSHSNNPKPLWWRDHGRADPRFTPFLSRITSVVVTAAEIDELVVQHAQKQLWRGQSSVSEDTAAGPSFAVPEVLEAHQRRRMFAAIKAEGLADGDAIVVGDVDEIPRRASVQLARHCDGLPWSLTLDMPVFHGSFAYAAYDVPKRSAAIRIFDGQRRAWIAHHSKQGDTLLLDAGWHCSWCFRYLDDFWWKMNNYIHRDRGRPSPSELRDRLCRGQHVMEPFMSIPDVFSVRGAATAVVKKHALSIRRTSNLVRLPRAIQIDPRDFDFLLHPGHCARHDVDPVLS